MSVTSNLKGVARAAGTVFCSACSAVRREAALYFDDRPKRRRSHYAPARELLQHMSSARIIPKDLPRSCCSRPRHMAQIYRMVGSFETLTVYHSAMLGVKIEGHFIPHRSVRDGKRALARRSITVKGFSRTFRLVATPRLVPPLFCLSVPHRLSSCCHRASRSR